MAASNPESESMKTDEIIQPDAEKTKEIENLTPQQDNEVEDNKEIVEHKPIVIQTEENKPNNIQEEEEAVTNINRSLHIFQKSKEIFLQEFEHRLKNTKPIPRKFYQYAKCLLVDSNPEISRATLQILTKALKDGDAQQAEYILDVNIPYFPMIDQTFATFDFEFCVKFFNQLLVRKPDWVLNKMLTLCIDLIHKSILSTEAKIVNIGFVMLHRIAEVAPELLWKKTNIIPQLIDILTASQALFDNSKANTEDIASWYTFYSKSKLDIKLGHPELFSNLIITLNYICDKLPNLNEETEDVFKKIYDAILANPFKLVCKKPVLRLVYTLVKKDEKINSYVFKNSGDEIVELGMADKDCEIRQICDNLVREFSEFDENFGAFKILIQNLHDQIEKNPNTYSDTSLKALKYFSTLNIRTCNVLIALGITKSLNRGLKEEAWRKECFELIHYIATKAQVLANRMTERFIIREIGENFNESIMGELFPMLLKNVHYIEPVVKLFQKEDMKPVEEEMRSHLMTLMSSRTDVFKNEHLIKAKRLTIKNQEKVKEFLDFIHNVNQK